VQIFYWTSDDGANEKVNFVDDDNNFVGIDMDPQCYEDFGWYITRNLDDAKDAALYSNESRPDKYSDTINVYRFDMARKVVREGPDEGGEVIWPLTRQWCPKRDGVVVVQEMWLHLYNHHNGYYSHTIETGVMFNL